MHAARSMKHAECVAKIRNQIGKDKQHFWFVYMKEEDHY
jgi:hypothetical protein